MSNSPKVERKLAAIVFTDIVGFTEITANDQSQSLDILNQQRELLKPLVESYNGKWLKEIGDGLLLIFDTVTDAVNCSIEIQNKTKSIDNLNLRIGIHQGEIVLQENDVIGDDINIASRIEPFSAIGGIAISNKVNDAIIREKEFQTEYIGKPKLKGVSQEVKVYCIVSHSLPKTDISKVSAKLEKEKSKFNIFTLTGGILTFIGILFWIYLSIFDITFAEESEVPSVAILPLDNKGATEDEFYAYGLSSELISNVASAGLIRVASLKDIEKLDYKLLNNKELAEKLDIRYIVNGTLWKLDSIFQLSLEVFDTKSSKILWSESWHNKWEELTSIKNILSIKLLDNFNISNNIISHSTTNSNSQAYEYYLKGKYLYENLSSSENRKNSIKFLNKAIELDSNLVIAKLELAGIYLESPMYFEYNRIYNEKSKMLIISSLKLSTITKNQLNLSNSLKMMGDFHYYWNDNDSASYYWKKAFNIYLLINDIKGIQDCQNSLAIIAKQSGNYILADSLYNESILSGDKIGNKRYNATTYQNLGMRYNDYYFLNGKKIMRLMCGF